MPAIPYLKYEDAASALDWLTKAFGFAERLRYAGPDGAVMHAEMTTPGGGVVYLAGPGGDYRNPRHTGHVSVMVSVEVDDVDAGHAQAVDAGATTEFPPTDSPQGLRACKVSDPEGHEWFLTQKQS